MEQKELLTENDLADKDVLEKFEFRNIKHNETKQVVAIEQICFPPNEADSEKNMAARIAAAQDLFLVAVDRETGKIAGFLNGIATDELRFRDEFLRMPDCIILRANISCYSDWMYCRRIEIKGLAELLYISI